MSVFICPHIKYVSIFHCWSDHYVCQLFSQPQRTSDYDDSFFEKAPPLYSVREHHNNNRGDFSPACSDRTWKTKPETAAHREPEPTKAAVCLIVAKHLANSLPDFTHNPSQERGRRTSCGQPLRKRFIIVIIYVETLHLCHTVRLVRQISNNFLMTTLCWVSLGAIKVSDIYICLMNHRAVAASGSLMNIHPCMRQPRRSL